MAAGVRRLEALTGRGVAEYYEKLETNLKEAAKAAKCEPALLVKRIETLQEEMKELQRENEKLKNKIAKDSMGDVMSQMVRIKDVEFPSCSRIRRGYE